LQSFEGDSGTVQGWEGGQLDLGCWEGNKEAHTIVLEWWDEVYKTKAHDNKKAGKGKSARWVRN
jgi:hypothetical protein